MTELNLKVKSKKGQEIWRDLKSTDTVEDMKKKIVEKLNIAETDLQILSGFPPLPLDLSANSKTLQEIGIITGDTLICEEKKNIGEQTSQQTINSKKLEAQHHVAEQMAERGLLLRKVVPADNSCLFTSIGFVLSGKIDTNCGSYMRQLIVEHVKNDPEVFSEAILGKPPSEYCSWILKSDSWGGAIELSILSKYYGIEIGVVDTINAIINRFGEDQSYSQRVLLVFDGIHYDPLYLESPMTDEVQTIFPITDDQILIDAQKLAQESQSSRQFTDVNRFTLKCLDCQIVLEGQRGAQEHAKETGHIRFGEV